MKNFSSHANTAGSRYLSRDFSKFLTSIPFLFYIGVDIPVSFLVVIGGGDLTFLKRSFPFLVFSAPSEDEGKI